MTTTQDVAAAHSGHGAEAAPSVIEVSAPLMALTWVTFVLVALALYKVAWKPILRALDHREQSIRKALDEAEKARAELAEIQARSRQTMAEAQAASEAILHAARTSAAALAATIHDKADQEARAMIEGARAEIAAATEGARSMLRNETAGLAVDLAGRVLAENMDSGRNRALVEKLMKDL